VEKESSRLVETFKELVELHSAPGDEGAVCRYIQDRIGDLADECFVDTFGNLFATRRGDPEKPSLMITAHTDEIGLAVSRIEENGFLRFVKVGFPQDALLPGHRVRVGRVNGVIGAKEYHVQSDEERKTMKKPEDLFIDVGAESIADAKAMGIKIGTRVTFFGEYTELGVEGNLVATKAVDDRAGCAVLMELLWNLEGSDIPGNVYSVFTAQEEVGLRGARMAAYRLNPTFALAIDTPIAADTPFCPSTTEDTIVLGGGPVIMLREDIVSVMRGMEAHPVVAEYLVRCAEKAQIKYQHGMILPSGATDATSIYDVREGIPSCFVGLPCRYTHSTVEVVDLRDMAATETLLREAVLGVSADMDFRPF
jgi:putative aminopeptidase FrvX